MAAPVRSVMLKNLRSAIRYRPIEFNSARRRLRRVATVSELRALAKRRLPRGVFDYIDGGAEDEVTMVRNLRRLPSCGVPTAGAERYDLS